MNKYLAILFIEIFLHNFSFATHSFLRIHHNQLDTLIKKFIDEKGNQVTLIPMAHIGDECFYEKVAKELEDKIVLYELAGCNLTESKGLNALVERLVEPHKTRANLVHLLSVPYHLLAAKFKLSIQTESLDYSRAAELIHADTPINSATLKLLQEGSTKKLEEGIERGAIQTIVGNSVNSSVSREQILENLLPLYEKNFKRNYHLKTLLEHLVAYADKTDEHYKSMQYAIEIAPRNKILIQKLEEILQRRGPLEIAVPFGVCHIFAVEGFLISKGFKLKEQKWIPIIKNVDTN